MVSFSSNLCVRITKNGRKPSFFVTEVLEWSFRGRGAEKKIFSDSELEENSVIRNFRITAEDGNVTAAIAKLYAETEFKKYRIIQDKAFMSNYDKYLLELEERAKGTEK